MILYLGYVALAAIVFSVACLLGCLLLPDRYGNMLLNGALGGVLMAGFLLAWATILRAVG